MDCVAIALAAAANDDDLGVLLHDASARRLYVAKTPLVGGRRRTARTAAAGGCVGWRRGLTLERTRRLSAIRQTLQHRSNDAVAA
jgi:hypothetical protein